eukprot:scaffold10220_cov36-Tisochrysis_lutea.AAC.3
MREGLCHGRLSRSQSTLSAARGNSRTPEQLQRTLVDHYFCPVLHEDPVWPAKCACEQRFRVGEAHTTGCIRRDACHTLVILGVFPRAFESELVLKTRAAAWLDGYAQRTSSCGALAQLGNALQVNTGRPGCRGERRHA